MRKNFVVASVAVALLFGIGACGVQSEHGQADVVSRSSVEKSRTVEKAEKIETPQAPQTPETAETPQATETSSVDVEGLARRVIAGEFGSGQARKTALGADYEAVQARVNELMSSVKTQQAQQPQQSVQPNPRYMAREEAEREQNEQTPSVVSEQDLAEAYQEAVEYFTSTLGVPQCDEEDGSNADGRIGQCVWVGDSNAIYYPTMDTNVYQILD